MSYGNLEITGPDISQINRRFKISCAIYLEINVSSNQFCLMLVV
jgi:hypothetical protein